MAADVQYVIDIAAQAAGVDTTIAELDAMAAQLSGVGKDAAVFQDAIGQVSSQLDTAREASESANTALATSKTEYAQLEKAADMAAKAAERAAVAQAATAEKAAAAQARVDAYASTLAGLASKSSAASAALEQGRARFEALRASVDGSAAAAAQVAALDAELAVLASRAADAGAALATGEAKMRGLEGAAAKAAKAAAGFQGDGGKLELTARAAAEAKAKLDAYVGTLAGAESKAKAAAAAEQKLADSLVGVKKLGGHLNKELSRSSENLSKMQSGLAAVGGPMGRLGQAVLMPVKGFADLRQTLGGAKAAMAVVAVGTIALVAALAALAVAAVAGVGAIAAYAVKLGDTRRSAALTGDAFAALRPELAGLDFVGVTNDTGIAADRLRDLAKTLTDAKVPASQLPRALRAAALAEAALGQGGAQTFIDDIKAAKGSVDELASATETKFGGIVSRQMLGLEAQGARLQRNFGDIFGGLDIEPALQGLAKLVGLFDKDTASGNALRTMFEGLFGPLIAKADKAAAVIEGFILGFEIGLMKLYISAKPTIKAIAEFFGFKDTSLTDVCKMAAKAGEIAAKVFVVVAAVLGTVAVVVATVVAGIFAFGVALVAAIGYAVKFGVDLVKNIVDVGVQIVNYFRGMPSNIVGSLVSLGQKVLSVFVAAFAGIPGFLLSMGWNALGGDMIAGLVGGITGSIGRVISAITGAVGGAIGAAKKMLGIASPSKVFAGLGENTGEGFAVGVENTTAQAQRATEDLIAPPAPAMLAAPSMPASALARLDAAPVGGAPVAPAAPLAAPAAAPAKAGTTVSITGATFIFEGVKDAEDAATRFGEWLTRAIEGDALALGGAT